MGQEEEDGGEEGEEGGNVISRPNFHISLNSSESLMVLVVCGFNGRAGAAPTVAAAANRAHGLQTMAYQAGGLQVPEPPQPAAAGVRSEVLPASNL